MKAACDRGIFVCAASWNTKLSGDVNVISLGAVVSSELTSQRTDIALT